MRNLFVSIIFSLLSISLTAQGCLPEGITFTTQAQIDSFPINYPGCTEIEGTVMIHGGPYLTNLFGLSQIISIEGSLIIGSMSGTPYLNNLIGLDNLESINGQLGIYFSPTLSDLSGLVSLRYIGYDLAIGGNDSLISLSGLDNLDTIMGSLHLEVILDEFLTAGNPLLVNLTGLESLKYIGESLSINKNNSLKDLSGLDSLNFLGGNLSIGSHDTQMGIGNDSLTSLAGMISLTEIHGGISIYDNQSLKDLNGLEGITSIGTSGYGEIVILENDSLLCLIGIENIEASSIDEIYIAFNPFLSICEVQSVCDYMELPESNVSILGNAKGCNSLGEIEEACETVYISEVSLFQNLTTSPNPFSTSTMLSYVLQQPTTVQLSIYNQPGQLVYQHIEDQQKGEQQLIWNAEGCAEGVYYYRLKEGDAVANGKMVKVK